MVHSVAELALSPAEVVAGFDAAMVLWAERLRALSPRLAIGSAQRAQQIFEAVELGKIAEGRAAGGSEREARDIAAAGGTRSKREAAKAARRAEAVRVNPGLAGGVGSGVLGTEQLDAIALASERSGGEAASDVELISEVRDAAPDVANRIAARWLERRHDENGVEARYKGQRKQRTLHFGFDANSGCESMLVLGDRESMDEISRAVRARADVLYAADGGRDVPGDQHPRTYRQRLFDSLCELLGVQAGLGVRSMLHVSVTVDDEAAEVIRAHTIDGAGLLPQSVLERYGCGSMLAGTVFSQQGQVLWHGRQKRHATDAQFAALVARDHGCVLCGAEILRCQAHHLMPWNAPGKGRTNIDEMALLCVDCHRKVHEQQLTLYCQLGPPGTQTKPTWHTRGATPKETPNTS